MSMETAEILAAFPGSTLVCRVCGANASSAYCDNCTNLTKKDTGRPLKWTECDKCGTHYLGVHASKKCMMHDCDGRRTICEVQPAKPKKVRREMATA